MRRVEKVVDTDTNVQNRQLVRSRLYNTGPARRSRDDLKDRMDGVGRLKREVIHV